jgi:hypothetical protein
LDGSPEEEKITARVSPGRSEILVDDPGGIQEQASEGKSRRRKKYV